MTKDYNTIQNMNKLLTILLLFITISISAQTRHRTKVELKDVDEETTVLTTTRMLLTDATTGEIKYIPLSTVQANVIVPVTGATNGLTLVGTNAELGGVMTKNTSIGFGTNTFTLNNLSAANFISMNGTTGLNTFHGSTQTFTGTTTNLNSTNTNVNGNLIIDPASSGSNIASSILTVKNGSTTTSTNVTQFIDVARNNTSDAATGETSALVSRVINSSSNVNDGIYGAQFIGRKTGSGNSTFNYGLFSTADQQASGNIDFLNSAVLRTNITGTGTTTVDFARNIGTDLVINNPNATVNNVQAMHPSIQMNAGTIGTVTNTFLDLDYDGSGVTVTGDINYLLINNDVLPTPTGSIYAIKSNTTAPSEFAGLVSTAQTNTQIDAASDQALIPKGWFNANTPNNTDFVDLTTNQSNIGGNKTFTGSINGQLIQSSAPVYSIGGVGFFAIPGNDLNIFTDNNNHDINIRAHGTGMLNVENDNPVIGLTDINNSHRVSTIQADPLATGSFNHTLQGSKGGMIAHLDDVKNVFDTQTTTFTSGVGSNQNYYTYNMPANTLKVGDIVEVNVNGRIANTAGTNTVTVGLSGVVFTKNFTATVGTSFDLKMRVIVLSSTTFKAINVGNDYNNFGGTANNERFRGVSSSGAGFDITNTVTVSGTVSTNNAGGIIIDMVTTEVKRF